MHCFHLNRISAVTLCALAIAACGGGSGGGSGSSNDGGDPERLEITAANAPEVVIKTIRHSVEPFDGRDAFELDNPDVLARTRGAHIENWRFFESDGEEVDILATSDGSLLNEKIDCDDQGQYEFRENEDFELGVLSDGDRITVTFDGCLVRDDGFTSEEVATEYRGGFAMEVVESGAPENPSTIRYEFSDFEYSVFSSFGAVLELTARIEGNLSVEEQSDRFFEEVVISGEDEFGMDLYLTVFDDGGLPEPVDQPNSFEFIDLGEIRIAYADDADGFSDGVDEIEFEHVLASTAFGGDFVSARTDGVLQRSGPKDGHLASGLLVIEGSGNSKVRADFASHGCSAGEAQLTFIDAEGADRTGDLDLGDGNDCLEVEVRSFSPAGFVGF